MTDGRITPAPRSRQALAALLDVAIFGGLAWLVRSRAGGSAAAAERLRWTRLLSAEFVREQLRSPGQRLLRLRTVDRRTGRPVALWRSLLLLGTHIGGGLLARRLRPAGLRPEQERERARFHAALGATYEQADDPAVEAQRRELLARRPEPIAINFWRAAGPGIALGLANRRLRRSLAPTREMLVRRG